ncbi:MAG: hypothetical protein ACYC69_14460 [Thermodesulfovibrionales bacterium]
MKNRFVLVFVLLALINTLPFPALADSPDREMDLILTSAESVFKAMKSRSYALIWGGLSLKSQETILDDTQKSLQKAGVSSYTKEQLMADFSSGAVLSKAYWDSFLNNFDPDTVLSQSAWKMGPIKKDKADVIISYKKSENPAVLKMFREEGSWKVGLVETFWLRK